ncbi:hypothetical protein BCV69DRAFT_279359 [Microstroma glucosiphilum]|uniref:Uncharacterized protein n=1 Tax=Pseudomicrostroma glucosiphilum TaxID=1684307 RepID=A0A316TYA7_9BASI|nr:hypothetical protein BCV69DRAFT_279359 [Pseudomicrostroma glucosiphilum]PWN17714.1 hypothetical protein BCV69DRAFT_279359 [Pseudomicrostroma glucosiphilum]
MDSPIVMSHSTSPPAAPWAPAPRVSSLVYRSSPHASESSKDHRPRPSAQDEVIASHFAALNAVEGDECWITGAGDTERVHIVPHAEGDCTRLILWLQLMELVPMPIQERAKWKVSHENLLPLSLSIHRCLTDGEKRKALLRPTREDLVLLVRVLEDGLQRECEQNFSPAWRPRWNEILQTGWPRKDRFGTLCLPSYELQLDIFDLKRRTISKWKDLAGSQGVSRVTGDELYPILLDHQLDTLQAPVSILAVVAVAVSQAWYISRSPGRRYREAFLEEMDIMSYIVNLLGSPSPSYFRGLQRPSALPPLPPLPQIASLSSPQRMREWPLTKPRTRSSAVASQLPEFSSSPPKGYKENLATALYEMDRAQIAEEGVSVSTDGGHEDSEGSGGASSFKSRRSEPRGDESRSSGGDSSIGSSDLSSISMLPPSPGLQDAKDATVVSNVTEQAQKQLKSSPEAKIGSTSVAPSMAVWHEEAQSLDDKQDLLLDDALSALASQLQAPSNQADSTTTATRLFDFLASPEPLDITSKLQAIEQRREEMLEQWEDGLK